MFGVLALLLISPRVASGWTVDESLSPSAQARASLGRAAAGGALPENIERRLESVASAASGPPHDGAMATGGEPTELKGWGATQASTLLLVFHRGSLVQDVALIFVGASLVLYATFLLRRHAKTVARHNRAIAAAAEHLQDDSSDDLEMLRKAEAPVDSSSCRELVTASKAAPTIKVHVDLSEGRVATVRVKKVLVTDMDSLMRAVHSAVREKEPTYSIHVEALAEKEVKYEDSDGDMVVLSRQCRMDEVLQEARSLYIVTRGRASASQSNRRSGKGRERKLLTAAEEGQSLLSEGLGSPSGSEAMSVAKDEEEI